MNTDDPKLTAYALDEVDAAERSAIARAIADSPEAQRFVAQTQKLARALRSQYGLEVERELIPRERLVAIHDDGFWSKAGPLAIAALLAVLAVIGAVALSSNRSGSSAESGLPLSQELALDRSEPNQFTPVEGENSAQASQNQIPDADAGPYAYTGERPFVSVMSKPLSSIPLLMNSAPYLDVRRSINAGVLPVKETVRIEAMINYFPYAYPAPVRNEPVSMNVDVVTCPWEPTHRLVRIGLSAPEPLAVTPQSRLEVEFNPKRVASYRLIGYDRQTSERQDQNERKIGLGSTLIGYTLTAFYEAVPLKRPGAAAEMQSAGVTGEPSEPLLSAKLQFTSRGDPKAVRFIERIVTDNGYNFAGAPEDLKFAAAVAEFGMILRDSDYKGSGTLQQVLEWAQQGKGADANGYRADFIELVRRAQALKRS